MSKDSTNRRAMKTLPSFEEGWAELRPKLEAYLRRNGVDRDTTDDVIQETALKLLKAWPRVDPTRPLWPLARVMAMNCLADRFRGKTAIPLGELPESPSQYDIEEHGLARARLAVASKALEGLPANDRSVILAEIGIGERSPDGAASRMARMRARGRLHAAMERLAPAFSGVALGWRRFISWIQSHGSLDVLGANALASLLVAVAAAVASLSSGPQLGSDGHRQKYPDSVSISKASARVARMPRILNKREPLSTGPTTVVKDRPQDRGPTSTADERVHARTGPTGAYAGDGQGYIYASVCFGQDTEDESDDWGVSVAVFTSDQSGEEEPPNCREDSP